jgi:hypothetical protein
MFLSPSASFTYSTKSALFGSRCSWVLRSSTRSAELAGHEVHAVALERRVRLAVAVVEVHGGRRRRERLLDDLAWKEHAAALRVRRQADGREPLQGVLVLDQHTRPLEDGQGFVDDPRGQRRLENSDSRAHNRLGS